MKPLEKFYPITEAALASTHLTKASYDEMYKQSIEQPNEFWAEQAEQFLDWYKPWDD